jgi:hypothetical protein
MATRLGYFRGFKGGNTVLLALDRADVSVLCRSIAAAVNNEEPLAIHEMALVAKQHAVRLFVYSESMCVSVGEGNWAWSIDLEDVDPKLKVLEHGNGHQYFDLEPKGTQLIVSVGEYDEQWWEQVDMGSASCCDE